LQGSGAKAGLFVLAGATFIMKVGEREKGTGDAFVNANFLTYTFEPFCVLKKLLSF